ncbi:hypothetical protein EMCRGX_G026390 [Ephydatia muelleri]
MKDSRPSTQITFLGILLDSEALTLSLPQEKLAEILLLWLDALGLSLPIKENARVCSIHFCKEDFVGVEGYAPSKPKLKSDAVPSLLLFNDPTFSKNSYCNGHSTTCGPDSVRLATYLEVYY